MLTEKNAIWWKFSEISSNGEKKIILNIFLINVFAWLVFVLFV